MAKQLVGIGTEANDQTGDLIRDAFDKINDNFNELYGSGGHVPLDTTVKEASFTGVVNNYYLIDISDSSFTLTLPTASIGDVIRILAFTTNQTYDLTVTSTEKIDFSTNDFTVDGPGSAGGTEFYEFTYINATFGWVISSNQSRSRT